MSSPNASPKQSTWPRPASRKRIGRHLAAAVLAGIVLIGSGAAGVAVRLFSITDPSPATGSARVIAQGIAPLLGEEVVWRAVRYQAQPRSKASVSESPLSFLIASDEPLLLSNDDPSTAEEDLMPEARLAPGEALMVRAGTRQQRASVTDESIEYIAMELVRTSEANNVGDGEVLFVSTPFVSGGTTPDLDFDLDLVSAVLAGSDSTTIPDTGQSVAILATDGAIDVIPSGGRRRTLQIGEGDVFTGELEIRPADVPTPGNAKQLIAAQSAPSGGATFVAAVVGPEIPPAAPEQPVVEVILPTETPVVVIPPTETPVPETPTPEPTVEPTPTMTPEPTLEPTWTPEPVLDSDQDGLADHDESAYGTSPRVPDSDGDLLSDGDEVYVYGTLPNNPNTDDDGCTDGYEAAEGFNPFEPDCYIIE